MDYLAILKNLDAGKGEASNMRAAVVELSYETNEFNEKGPVQSADCIECGPKCPALRQIEAVCWHCSGSALCGCISCAEGLAVGESGQCLMCHGCRKVMVWVH